MILSDNETKVDLLNSEPIAKTIIKLLRERPDKPITIGIHGDWGAGKSSVLEMVENLLSSERKVVCIKFNGWRYQGFEDAKIALLESIVTDLVEKRSLMTKAKDQVADVFKRIDYLKLAKRVGSVAFTALSGIPSPELVTTVVDGIKNIAADPAQYATAANLKKVAEKSEGLLKAKESNVPAEINEFREAFDKLLDKANCEQLVVLVDDLDRCLPDTAIETLEAIRLFLFTNRTAFVIGADEAMIEYAVKRHFPDLPESAGYQAYTRNYLEKLIQVPFRIPVLGEQETRMYVSLLLIASNVGEDDDGFTKLIEEARKRISKPWEFVDLDAETIKKTLGTKASSAQNALLISEQIGPTLAAGTKGNPRQIKRFLNTLLMRQLAAEARGFGQSVTMPVLAKLMIAERFMPRLFDQIALSSTSSESGICPELAELERQSSETPVPPTAKKKSADTIEPVRVEYSQTLTEWIATEEIVKWSKLKPKLADVDIRPYLFVAKEKHDYFGKSSALGALSTLVESLCGSKFAIKTLTNDIRALNSGDAKKVFDALRIRISGGEMKAEPAGIPGIIELIKLHPQLQSNLVDFLESISADSLGAWVVTGWQGVINDAVEIARLDKLLTTWAENSKNPLLKAAATAALKLRKK